MLIVLGDGLHEIEPVAAFPALEFIDGHGDDSSVATAEIGHGFSIVHPARDGRPPRCYRRSHQTGAVRILILTVSC